MPAFSVLLLAFTLLVPTLLVPTLLMPTTAHAHADARLACAARCETPAAACMVDANKARDACVVAARQTCRTRSPAEQFNCLRTTGGACATGRSSRTQACRATFDACHKACGAGPADKVDYWCSLDFDGTNGRVYREWLCAGMPGGENPSGRCVGLLKDVPEAGYSLTCDPVL